MAEIEYYKYVGEGEYIPNPPVPARDLTVEEYQEHDKTIAANAKATGRPLYVPVRKPKVTEVVASDGEGKTETEDGDDGKKSSRSTGRSRKGS